MVKQLIFGFAFITTSTFIHGQKIAYLEGIFISYEIMGKISYDQWEGQELIFHLSSDSSRRSQNEWFHYINQDSIMEVLYKNHHANRIYWDWNSGANMFFDMREEGVNVDSLSSELKRMMIVSNSYNLKDYINANTLFTYGKWKSINPDPKQYGRTFIPSDYYIQIKLFKGKLFIMSHEVNQNTNFHFNYCFNDYVWDSPNEFYRYTYKPSVGVVKNCVGFK